MAVERPYRTIADLERTVRALATDSGPTRYLSSGAKPFSWDGQWRQALFAVRPEIDAYPGNARVWEIEEKKKDPNAEASEHVNALFGYGSMFHRAHGFYVDGVDESTAKLPPEWEKRALTLPIDVAGRSVLAVAPCPEDLIVSKLARLDSKDKTFVEAYHAARPLDLDLVERRLRATDLDAAVIEQAAQYLHNLRS